MSWKFWGVKKKKLKKPRENGYFGDFESENETLLRILGNMVPFTKAGFLGTFFFDPMAFEVSQEGFSNCLGVLWDLLVLCSKSRCRTEHLRFCW